MDNSSDIITAILIFGVFKNKIPTFIFSPNKSISN